MKAKVHKSNFSDHAVCGIELFYYVGESPVLNVRPHSERWQDVTCRMCEKKRLKPVKARSKEK